MLTDTEVADVARTLLAGELADLTPSDSLLADVRSRYQRTRTIRRAATGAAAAVTAVGLAAAVVAGTSAVGHQNARPANAIAPRSTRANRSGDQTIVLEGFTVRVAPPLTVIHGPRRELIVTLAGKLRRLSIMLFGGPIPAAAVQVQGWSRLAYLVSANGNLSVYLPFPTAAQPYHSLVISAPGITRSELLRLASAIVVVMGPGRDLHGLPSSAPARCPCG
jgi:hypothetical protein